MSKQTVTANDQPEPTFNIRLVSSTTYRNIPPVTKEDESKFPFMLYANFQQPSFMEVTWALLYGGSEEFTIRGDTVETLQAFAAHNTFPTHSHLRRLQIFDKDKKVVCSLVPGQDWQEGDVKP